MDIDRDNYITGPAGSRDWIRLHDGTEHQLATAGSRFGARVIDAVILVIGTIVVSAGFVAGLLSDSDSGGLLLGSFLLLLAGIAYEVTLIALRGQTLGKQAVGIKVLRITDSQVPGWGKSFGRWGIPNLLSLIPLVGWLLALIGHISLLWDNNRQSWYDKAAGTVVVRANRQQLDNWEKIPDDKRDI